jgi:hypothetical protein
MVIATEIPGAKEEQSQLYSSRPASVEVTNGNFFWDDQNTKRALHNINMTVHKGHFCVVLFVILSCHLRLVRSVSSFALYSLILSFL